MASVVATNQPKTIAIATLRGRPDSRCAGWGSMTPPHLSTVGGDSQNAMQRARCSAGTEHTCSQSRSILGFAHVGSLGSAGGGFIAHPATSIEITIVRRMRTQRV